MHSGFPSPTILCCCTSLRLRLLLMADSDNEQNKSNLVVNQHYDETVEVNDEEEVASTFTPSPRPGGSRPNAPGRLSMSMTDHSDDEFDHDNLVEKKGPVGYGQSGGGGGTGSGGGDSSQLNPERTKPGLQGIGNDDDDDDDDEGDDQSDTSDDDDDDDDNHGPAVEGAYDPADYEHLPVSQEIKELFQYITRYTPQTIDLEHKLKPFIPDFIPAVGDIDAFIKVTRPDGKPETLGLLVLDEPTARQSDPTVLDLQLRTISKQTNLKAMTVRSIDDVEKNPKAIDTWIESIRELHRQKPAPTVHYQRNMPDIEELMQEWPSEFEDLLNTVGLPSAELDVDLAQYVDLICGILDIPVHKNRIHSLHVLFTLFSEFKNSQHFHQLAKDNQLSNDLKKPATEMNEMTGAAEQLNLNDSQALRFE